MGKRKVDPEIARLRSRLGRATQLDNPDEREKRRVALREAVLAKHIQKAVATAPPFTPEQIEKLRSLLPPVQENENGEEVNK